MLSVLVISSSARTSELIKTILISSDAPHVELHFVSSGAEARRRITEREYDLIFIDSPLSDEYGNELAIYVAFALPAKITVIAVNTGEYDETGPSLSENGIVVLHKPLTRFQFMQLFNLASTFQSKLIAMNDANEMLKTKLEETRVIDKAKFILLEKLGKTEEYAHKYLQSMSMNNRISKYEAALEILKHFDAS